MLEKIHIFHTNDLHSHFEYWLRMQNFIKEQRQLLASRGEVSFLFDIGDHMDRSNIYTEATLGKGNVELLNEAQLAIMKALHCRLRIYSIFMKMPNLM